MTDIKKHQNLVELEGLVNRLLANQTNNSYAGGIKHSYKIQFIKGDKALENNNGKIRNYYKLLVDVIDKTELIEQTINIYTEYYPYEFDLNRHQLHEKALKEFLSVAVATLSFNAMTMYRHSKHKEQEEANKLLLNIEL